MLFTTRPFTVGHVCINFSTATSFFIQKIKKMAYLCAASVRRKGQYERWPLEWFKVIIFYRWYFIDNIFGAVKRTYFSPYSASMLKCQQINNLRLFRSIYAYMRLLERFHVYTVSKVLFFRRTFDKTRICRVGRTGMLHVMNPMVDIMVSGNLAATWSWDWHFLPTILFFIQVKIFFIWFVYFLIYI